MRQYQYQAKDSNGESAKGKIEAADKSAAVRMLKEKKLFILSLSEISPDTTPIDRLRNSIRKLLHPITSEELMIFTRELATMINSSFPLVTSIDILGQDVKNEALQSVVRDVAQNIRGGGSFSESLEKHPAVFSNLYVSLVKAGEAGGELDKTLDRLAAYLESSEKIRRRIKGALIYPTILIIATIAILGIFFLFAIPKFREIYVSLDSELPFMTNLFLNISGFLQKNVIPGLAILAILLYGLSYYIRTDKGRRLWDSRKLRTPILRDLYLKESISRFARTLALLYTSGVPFIESINLVSNVADNVIIKKIIADVAVNIQEGEGMCKPLKESKLFPSMTVNMIEAGEKSGTLDQMLFKIADLYDLHIDTWLSTLSSIIEPVLVIFLGCVIGFIILVMALPIMNLPTILH